MKQFTCGSCRNHAGFSPAGVVLGVAACLLLGGCGEEADSLVRAPVGGTIFVSGKPLASGIVRFVPIGETDGPMTIATVRDGCFSLVAEEGPVVGTHRIEIVATDFLGFDPGNQEAAERARKTSGNQLPRSPVPPRYRFNSPLMAEIPPQGDINLNFDLTSNRPNA